MGEDFELGNKKNKQTIYGPVNEHVGEIFIFSRNLQLEIRVYIGKKWRTDKRVDFLSLSLA